ncbi:hypothetical protein GCM10027068_52190 [Prescottella soli]
MPLFVSSRLRIAATRVTVSLRGIGGGFGAPVSAPRAVSPAPAPAPAPASGSGIGRVGGDAGESGVGGVGGAMRSVCADRSTGCSGGSGARRAAGRWDGGYLS